MERVKKGEKYWFINSFGEVVSKIESGVIDDVKRFESGNYFTIKEDAEAMAEKFRAVLKGASVIDLPGEEELETKIDEVVSKTIGDLATSFLGWINELSEMFCKCAILNAVDWIKTRIKK